ncbi:MAG TPA: PPK2 family polyphosphate kinase [Gemmatimonadales bacterium]|jgi:polyphosphate:nucleotide phosphotransferase, PPK2 family
MSSHPLRLSPHPPGTTARLTDAEARLPEQTEVDKDDLEKKLDELTDRLDRLQRRLYAEGRRALLVVLQGRDASGKDGTLRKVFGPLDPLGAPATSFKAPTEEERRHDFLWRVHRAVPGHGTIGLFNRSHYEDVLVVRVRKLAPEAVWRPRYEQINQFERMLVENGTVILKFFLHLSREEQRERLLARLEDPEKYWKFNANDLAERALWDEYTEAYREVLARTSTEIAPWYVVPADNKRVRDVLVAGTVVEALELMSPQWPGPPPELEALRAALTPER